MALGGCVGRLVPFGAGETEGDSDGTDDAGSVTLTGGPSDPTRPTDPTDPTSPSDTTTVGPMDGPPQLIDAQLLDRHTVELVFSEAMAPTEGVDPAKFRLSAAWGNPSYYGTQYQDLGQWGEEGEVCKQYCWPCYGPYCYEEEYCYEYCYTPPGPPVRVISLENGPLDNRILLRLDHPVTSSACETLEYLEDFGWTSGVFVHYSSNGAPEITDTQGESLDAISEPWVLNPSVWDYVEGHFPHMDPFIPIPCPF